MPYTAKSPALSGVQCPANTAPACTARGIHFSGSRTESSKCSGAKRFTRSMPASRLGATASRMPRLATTRPIIARRERCGICRRISSATRAASASLSVTKRERSSPEPCSACERTSSATHAGSAESSASTAISLGPATWSNALVT